MKTKKKFKPISYSRQAINNEDIKSLVKVLKSDFLTTGPKIKEFEQKFAKKVGAKYSLAVCNGTAALHLACLAAGLEKDDELITSALTFCASANCALYCQAKPVFVDINNQGLIDENKIEAKITKKTKIIIPVHYAGLPCRLDKVKRIAKKHHLIVIEDAAHALGAKYKKSKIGDCSYSDMTIFSLHAVKHITTGEGGMITTNNKKYYQQLLMLRNHGITKENLKFKIKNLQLTGSWYHEMQVLGYNYRLTDFQATLGISQLKRLGQFVKKRRQLAQRYNQAFKENNNIEIIREAKKQFHSYHLYPIRVKNSQIRLQLFNYLKSKNIFCQVHYLPVYWHPYYQQLGYKKGLCPQAERFYQQTISIPLHAGLTRQQQNFVIKSILDFFNEKNK